MSGRSSGRGLEGRRSLADHFAGAAGIPLEITPQHTVIHETADPEVIVAEFEYAATNPKSCAHAVLANILTLRSWLRRYPQESDGPAPIGLT